MELTDDFRLGLPVERAWALLQDLSEVARWVPGAVLESVEDGVHRGTVALKVGPVTATFAGTAELTRVDDELHQAVITATGVEASSEDGPTVAIITVTIRELGDGCQVDVHTRADVRGRVATFGEGVLQEVSTRTLRRFKDAMRRDLGLGPSPRPLPEGLPPIEVPPEPVLGEPVPEDAERPTSRVRMRTPVIPVRDPDAPPTLTPAPCA